MAKKKNKRTKTKNSRTFNMFQNLSMVNKISARKMIDEVSNLLDGEVKDGFDCVINDLYDGKDSLPTIKDVNNIVKEIKSEEVSIDLDSVDDLKSMIEDVSNIDEDGDEYIVPIEFTVDDEDDDDDNSFDNNYINCIEINNYSEIMLNGGNIDDLKSIIKDISNIYDYDGDDDSDYESTVLYFGD